MSLILGMDIWVFLAWIGTILAAIFCVLYGIYYEYFKSNEKESSKVKKKQKQKKVVK